MNLQNNIYDRLHRNIDSNSSVISRQLQVELDVPPREKMYAGLFDKLSAQLCNQLYNELDYQLYALIEESE